MALLLFTLFLAVASIGLLLCAVYLRSKSLATLSLCLWAVMAFVIAPWSYLGQSQSPDPDQQYAWDASLVWAVFFGSSIVSLIFCALASRMAQKPSKRRRRRRKSRSSDSSSPEQSEVSMRDI